MVRAVIVLLGMIAAAIFVVTPGQASLDQPDEPLTFPFSPDGLGAALPLGEFQRRMAILSRIPGKPGPERQERPEPGPGTGDRPGQGPSSRPGHCLPTKPPPSPRTCSPAG